MVRLEAELAYAEDYLRRVEPLLARQFVTADRVSEARSRRDAGAAAVQEARRRARRRGRRGGGAQAASRRRPPAVARRARGSARPPSASTRRATTLARPRDLLAQYADVNARLAGRGGGGGERRARRRLLPGRAPFDAYVTNLNIAVGEYARQGQQVFALVDDRAWYVLANFRETYMAVDQAGHDGRGLPAELSRAAASAGVVQGIGWANHPDDGATVGVLPDVRQTLNWVRLANRFPVRILLEERDPERPFRMGTTAVVTIRGGRSRTRRAPVARRTPRSPRDARRSARRFLEAELGPRPGRLRAALRIVVAEPGRGRPHLLFQIPHGHWTIMTIFTVSQADAGASLRRRLQRIVGTLAGGARGLLAVIAFIDLPHFYAPVLGLAVVLGVYLSHVMAAPYPPLLGVMTYVLVTLSHVEFPEDYVDVALWRIVAIGMGVVLGTGAQLFLWPDDPIDKLRAGLARRLHLVRSLVDQAIAPSAIAPPVLRRRC